MKKLFFIFLGSCTFALGTLGIFLPLLPTTGFYLLTAFFWMRSSDKLYNKFLASSYYQKYIQEAFFEKKITRFICHSVFNCPKYVDDYDFSDCLFSPRDRLKLVLAS